MGRLILFVNQSGTCGLVREAKWGHVLYFMGQGGVLFYEAKWDAWFSLRGGMESL